MPSDFLKTLREFAVPIVIGLGSAAVTVAVSTVRLEERVANTERDVARHEAEIAKALDRHEIMLGAISTRDGEQDKRLVRLDTTIETISRDVTEIKSDVKAIMKETR